MSKPPQKRLCWRMKEIRESVKIPFSDNRIACIARSLVTSRQERRAKRAYIWANLADAGHVYTMAVIRQQSPESLPSLTIARKDSYDKCFRANDTGATGCTLAQ